MRRWSDGGVLHIAYMIIPIRSFGGLGSTAQAGELLALGIACRIPLHDVELDWRGERTGCGVVVEHLMAKKLRTS